MMDTSWLEFAIRGAGLLLAALLLALLLRPWGARVRGAVLLAALTGLIALPVATWVLPRYTAQVLPASGVEGVAAGAPATEAPAPLAPRPDGLPFERTVTPRVEAPPAVAPTVTAPPPLVAPPASPARVEPVAPALPSPGAVGVPPAAGSADGFLVDWFAVAFFAGACVVLLPWIVGLLRVGAWARGVRRLDRNDVAGPEGIVVGVHASVHSPMTVGLFRSTILLPEEAASWSCETLRAALLHEAAHATRRDVLAAGIARIACALHWFNPLVWIVAASLKRDSELACDEAVLEGGVTRHAFAKTLLLLARTSRHIPLHGAAAGWGRSALERRVEAALHGPGPRRRGFPQAAAGLALALAFLAAATLQPTAETQADETEVVLTVGPEDGDHTTIQAALDAAPEGARVRIEAGVYEERVSIEKAVTLEGAGWTKTRLVSKYERVGKDRKRPLPTVLVRAAKGVVLRGLRIALEGEDVEGSHLGGAAVDIEASKVLMEDCAVVPSPASGLDVSGDADLVIRRCLVAAIGSTGIRIGDRGAGMPKVRILDSDVRYGHSRCISIGTSCDDVVIEGCRISGSGWHGVCYANASPTIRRNRITDNVRSGIYATGRTRATIEGNLFADTGLGGVSCWYHSGDVIQGNTFAHNAREGLAILGASAPTVTRNVFHRNPIGVKWSGIGGDRGASVPSEDLGTVRGNVFWENQEDLSRSDASDAGNARLDPVLGADYVLDADSPARALGVGATDLPPKQSPFPTQPEEAASERRYREHLQKHGDWEPKRPPAPSPAETARNRSQAAHEMSRAWSDRIRSIEDAEDREAALAEMYESFRSEDEVRRLAALRTAAWLGSVAYDRDAWRARILPHARSEDRETRWAARLALVRVKPDPAVDLPMWLEEAQTADSRNAELTTETIVKLVDGVLEGRAADAILHLLRDGTDIRKAFVIRGLQQAKEFDSRVMERMIEVVRSAPARSYDSIYWFHFIAPDLEPKSDAVLNLMLFRAGEGAGNLGTILLGLRTGLSDAQKRRVADRLLTFLENASSKNDQTVLLQALSWVADADQSKKAEALARERGLDPGARGPMPERPRRAERLAEQTKAQAAFQAGKQTQGWLETIRSSKDGAARLTALAKLRVAIDSDDEALRRAALWSAAWLGDVQLDRDDFRAAILPHTKSEDRRTRQAALLALARIKPDPAHDLPLWLEEAKTVDRNFAEFTTRTLVQFAGGIVEGEVADAILHLLRDGADIHNSDVARGLQDFQRLDPRVVARLVERVREATAESYDSVYFFIFLAPKLDPKSDAVVDVILFRLAEGKYALADVAKGLQRGLSEVQKRRVADRLLEILAEGRTQGTQVHLFDALSWTADASHLGRLETVWSRTDLTKAERTILGHVLERCRKEVPYGPVRTYQSYSAEDFANSGRPVKARDLVEIMADPKASLDLRVEALRALQSQQAKTFDPDLQRKRGRWKPRNEFCRRYVTKLLGDKQSRHTRRFAHELLLSYFPEHRADVQVVVYDSKDGTRAEWRKAVQHWNRVLRK